MENLSNDNIREILDYLDYYSLLVMVKEMFVLPSTINIFSNDL